MDLFLNYKNGSFKRIIEQKMRYNTKREILLKIIPLGFRYGGIYAITSVYSNFLTFFVIFGNFY
jgi:hypothetical protein